MNVATPTMSTDAATKQFVDLLKADVETLHTDYETLIASVTRPLVHLFTTTSKVQTRIIVDVHVDNYVNFCSVYLYWLLDLDTILQYFQVDLIDNIGMVEFWNLDPARTYIVELYVEDKLSKSKVNKREGYPTVWK